MTLSSLRIIVTGLAAQYPLGGVAWDYLQYVAGLARLGHDVFYIEDAGQWPYNPVEGGLGKDCAFNVAWLGQAMARLGVPDRWAYRFPWQSQWFGPAAARRAEIIASADLLINVSGTLERPADYRAVRRLAYIDSDPMFTQIKLAQGQTYFRGQVDAHDVHFSFGERLSPLVPDTGHRWLPTRQPVVLAEWRPDESFRPDVFTTVINWTSYGDVTWQGRSYGQKDAEFRHYLDLPRRVAPAVLELAINVGKTRHTPKDRLRHLGWKLVDPMEACPDLDGYRRYVETSAAEWSVAKHAYVAGRTGWFSCRSACYLAAGRPVVVQDTGFSEVLPCGEGILAFTSPEEAADAVAAVRADYPRHARAARALAEAHFDSDRVLTGLIERAMAGP